MKKAFSAILICITILVNICTAQVPGLKDVYKNDFLVGAALGYNFAQDSLVVELVKNNFNVLTPENQMKWGPIHPKEDTWNFGPTDQLIDFALANNIQVIGHTLNWYQQTPNWVFQDSLGNPASRELLISRMQNHITTLVSRYKGKVLGYDAVNEAVNDPQNEDGPFRNNKYRQIIGDEYMLLAFQFARQADPNVELYYNDYDMADPVKRDRAVILLKYLLENKAPISAVGMQAHWNLYDPSIEEIEKSILTFSELGLKVMITELDICLFKSDDKSNPYQQGVPEDILLLQAERYEQIFKLFVKHTDKISRVTFWGSTDKYSWLNNWPVRGRVNAPLLFNRDAQPKPAYFQIMQKVK